MKSEITKIVRHAHVYRIVFISYGGSANGDLILQHKTDDGWENKETILTDVSHPRGGEGKIDERTTINQFTGEIQSEEHTEIESDDV